VRLTVLGGCGALNPLLRASASQAGRLASRAGAGQLVLTHLMPGTDPDDAVLAAAEGYARPLAVASPGLIVEADR
jgi:ribonuclease BN (tRNA processing enzyme)